VNVRNTGKATVTDHKMTDFGALRLKGEGESIQYDDPIDGPDKPTPRCASLSGYKITREMEKHDLYGQMSRLEKALIKSAVDLQEVTAAYLINNGFGTTAADGFSATGFDGLGSSRRPTPGSTAGPPAQPALHRRGPVAHGGAEHVHRLPQLQG
jgi:hypothetical protein